ncbi:alpha/beta fold hydrolase [Kibdelosporangium phytohabitans]|uniref:Alpha/beta hydrolase n=1 Tax=Kibdelosporangium phytohabitans TaxID=860235 RepID=A0A0N9HUG7_9PSEU|nr:alpha/beta hydrolase [Kibdelosporangium phytohabitans]ALG08627.1 alpha/beta hydrolase [Kibdelosporangium phytohabitans]MBE1470281.1 pimeloyl-ACP methyl ester carboxylesterase [Kibdelosporangium phytohabitans]
MISRRLFTQAVVAGAAATSLAACSSDTPVAPAKSPDLRAGSGKNTSLGTIKQINAGVLDVAYAEFGPSTGQPVILLHGWPYDAYSYVDVAPLLASAGYRVIVPYLRGYGKTAFLSAQTVRNGQQSAIASDIAALMDALKIEKAILGGFDWGARTVGVMATLWPERCKAAVMVSGYIITNLKANQQPLPPAAEQGWWYQYYFATERGLLGYRQNRHDFNKLIWKNASPRWAFDDATYERSATSWGNPDHVGIVIHNYRWRLGLAPGEPQYEAHEQELAAAPAITVPAITIGSDFDGAAADGKSYRAKFSGKYEHRVFTGIGHNVPQEAPQPFAQAIMDADRL